MGTRSLLSLVAGLALVIGCGGDDGAEAKQGALPPAPPSAGATVEKPVARPAPVPSAPAAETAAVAADPAPAESEPDRTLGREAFSYTGGSRDPFISLLATAKVGPELPDLLLVAIYYDTRNVAASVVVMREKVGGRKYTLRPGDRLGRMRVTEVRPKDVVFTIDDFGTERQETVSLRKEDKQ